MKNLSELARKYSSDKSDHNYMPYYEKHLPKDCRSLLEIGVKEGASMRMWREFFPNTELWGMDLFIEFPEPTDIDANWIKGNQCDHEILYNIRHHVQPQVILDDGSHNVPDQLVSFFSLAGCCELYIIEDLHTSNDPFYRQGLPFELTPLGMMKSGKFPLPFDLYDDKIAFIKTK